MAKNDYFVIAYKILRCLYAYFEAGEKPDLDMFSPEALKINNGYWVNVMRSLSEEGYIKGISFPPTLGDMCGGTKIYDLRITEKGIDFLQNNSNMAKAKSFLREFKEIVPGI